MPAPYSPEPTREGRREPNAVRHALPLVSGGRRRRFDAAGDCASGCRPWAVGRREDERCSAAPYASTARTPHRSVRRQSNDYGFSPFAPVQLLGESVQEIFESRIDRAAPIRPPGSAFLLSQSRSVSNLSLARAEPMNVDIQDGSHTRKSVQRRDRNPAPPLLHVVLAYA